MKQRQQGSTSYPMLFLMVLSSDSKTGATGLSPTVTISKNGGSFAAPSGAVTEIAHGWYALAGHATDRSTSGAFLLHAEAAGADPTDDRYTIVPWDPFDAVRMGLTALPNAAPGANGGLPTQNGNKINQTVDLTSGQKIDLVDAPNSTALIALAAAIEAAIINETDGKQVLKAITDKIASVNPSLSGLTLAAIAAQVRTELATELARIDAAISSRLPSSGYTAPDNANVATIAAAIAHATYGLSALQALIAALPSSSGIKTALEAAGGYLALIKAVSDKYGTMVETDGDVSRFTANALEEAPSGEAGGLILPVMQGRVYSVTAIQGAEVVIVQGDTPTIPFDLGDDYSEWTPYFGAKAALADTDYAIDPKAGTWIDATEGEGSVALTASETATVGKLFAEIELRNGDSRLTAIKFSLKIIAAVINDAP